MSIGRDQGVLPTMLTDGDVARTLMISKSTLRRIIARKEMKFTYSGKRRRYLPVHVVEYLKTQEVDGCPSQPRERAKSTDTGSPQRPGSAMWYRTWFDAETRQTRRVSLGTGDFESAGLALATWVAANAKPRDADPREVPLAGVFVRYHGSLGPRHPGAASQLISLRMIDRVVQPYLSVAEFMPGVQEAAARALREQGYAQGSVKRALSAAKAAVNWAWKEGLIDRQIPFASVSEGRQRERFLSIEELARLWDADMPDHVRAFLALAIGTSSRPKALLELKRSQCNLERRVIDLNPSGRIQTKKRRPVLPMAEWLVPWIERSDTYVVEFRGKPVQKLAGAFRTMRDAAGFGPEVTAYTVRHTIATQPAVRNVP